MNHSRRLLPLATFALVTLALVFGWALQSSREAKEAPRNVLFIMADDHSPAVFGAYGNSRVQTPNLDRLAAQSVRFTRAFANSPLCTPSRQSLITGRYPHASGVTLLRTPLAQEQITIADHLKQAGFQTGAVGKMHFNSRLKHGFDFRVDGDEHDQHLAVHPPRKPPADVPVKPHWNPFEDPARLFMNADYLPGNGYPWPGNPEVQGYYDKDFLGTFFVERAADFLRDNKDNRFCLWLSFYEPHAPFNFPVEYARRFDPAEMPLPEPGPEDDRWIPLLFKELTTEEKKGIVASYYTSVEYLDTNVGRILKILEEEGLAENTLVVYVGDHGYLLGDHGRFEKQIMWDEAVRIPMLIRDPGREPAVSHALVEMLDLTPTILERLGTPPMPSAQGKSLVPLLDGETDTHRDFVFSEYYEDNKAMVRTAEWKYILTRGDHDLAAFFATGHGPSGRLEKLYDLTADPKEFYNVAGDPGNQQILEEMREKMLGVFLETDPRAVRLPDGLSKVEKLAWFLIPPEGADKIFLMDINPRVSGTSR